MIVEILAWVLGGFGVIGTLLPFLRYDDWWIRDFDYPRVQLSIILLAAIGLIVAEQLFWNTGSWILLGASSTALLYQVAKILPYTPVWKNQVKDVGAQEYQRPSGFRRDRSFIRLLMANVLQKNDRYDLLLERIEQTNPDLVLTLETNQRWQNELDKALIEDYPYTIKAPKENRYGMHLYSRFELRDETINYHVDENQPSIYTEVEIAENTWVKLYGVHPSVPSPTEQYASTERDGELAIVSKKVADAGNERTIVAGDLNDVAWSHSTRLFQRISGLLDPRRGRGFYATFHADYWFARWPLDHVFHSPDFRLAELKRLKHIGSDHFPVFVSLAYIPSKAHEQQALEKEDGDEEIAQNAAELAKAGEENTVL